VREEPPLDQLHRHERDFTLPSLTEAIRLLRSEKFRELTGEHIHAVGEYRAIELSGETFFERAFSSGKEAAATLGYAHFLGRDAVLDDLLRLLATLRAPSA
jgi:hypothetical protein